MTLQVPSLLMLVGAALLAVAIFAPGPAGDEAMSGLHAAGGGPPAWPQRFDPRAAGCDPAARIELIGGLADVGAGWSDAVLRAALDEETDPQVRRALEEAAAYRNAGPPFGAPRISAVLTARYLDRTQ